MAEHNEWKCCQTTTCSHELSKAFPFALELLKMICRREGCKEKFFTSEKAWNLDLIEVSKAKKEGRDCRKTMDCFFAIKSKNEINVKIVDFKSNTRSKVPTVDKTEVEEKIRYSRQLIGMTYMVHPLPVLVYPRDRIQQAKNAVSRKFIRRKVVEVKAITDLQCYFN